MTLDSVRKLLLRRAKPHQKYRGTTGIKAWCEAHGVAATHVSEFVNGKRGPAPDMLEALGLEWRIMRKGSGGVVGSASMSGASSQPADSTGNRTGGGE